MAKRKKVSVKKNVGKRKLNIIYFVDSEKTRSIKFSLGLFRVLVVAIALTVVWVGVATWASIEIFRDRAELARQLESALATIFDYQTRYEGVYEDAYPEHSAKSDKAGELASSEKPEADAPSAKEVPQVKEPTENATTAEGTVNSPPEAGPNVVFENAAKGNSSQIGRQSLSEEEVKKLPVNVESAAFKRTGENSFTLKFEIRNNRSPEKAEGYVWAVARLVMKDQRIVNLGSPQGVKLDDKSKPINPESLNKYSIRYYKHKILKFHGIKEDVDEIRNVIIGILNSSGETITYQLNVGVPWEKNSQTSPDVPYNEEEIPLSIAKVASLRPVKEAL